MTESPDEPDIPDRQCGRCRGWFDGDAPVSPNAMPEWWLCPSCHGILLGPSAATPATP